MSAGVLALHRLDVRSASAFARGVTAVTVFRVSPRFGALPDWNVVRADLRHALEGTLPLSERLAAREAAYARRSGIPVVASTVRLVDDASETATVVEVRAPDELGVLHRITAVLDSYGLDVRSAHVSTLGADVVDAFYVVGRRLGDRPEAERGSSWWRRPARGRPAPEPASAAARLTEHSPTDRGLMFDTLSDRLDKVFTSLRGKGRLSEADIDATAREIRIALLEADVALPVVKAFIAAVKERAPGEEVSKALNPAQQVIKIVNEELVAILGGETRLIRFAKTPPTVIMLAGLQGAGKTTLAGKLAKWLKAQGHAPLLVACDLQRPNAVQQLQVVGGQAGVDVFAPEPGSGVGDPVDGRPRRGIEHAKRMQPRRRRRRHRRPARHRRRDDGAGRGHPRRRVSPTRSCSSSTR